MVKRSFEESLARLEQITEDLESGAINLEDSLKKFDEGVKLADFCHQKLQEAQQKVDLLLKKNGRLQETPFGEPRDDQS